MPCSARLSEGKLFSSTTQALLLLLLTLLCILLTIGVWLLQLPGTSHWAHGKLLAAKAVLHRDKPAPNGESYDCSRLAASEWEEAQLRNARDEVRKQWERVVLSDRQQLRGRMISHTGVLISNHWRIGKVCQLRDTIMRYERDGLWRPELSVKTEAVSFEDARAVMINLKRKDLLEDIHDSGISWDSAFNIMSRCGLDVLSQALRNAHAISMWRVEADESGQPDEYDHDTVYGPHVRQARLEMIRPHLEPILGRHGVLWEEALASLMSNEVIDHRELILLLQEEAATLAYLGQLTQDAIGKRLRAIFHAEMACARSSSFGLNWTHLDEKPEGMKLVNKKLSDALIDAFENGAFPVGNEAKARHQKQTFTPDQFDSFGVQDLRWDSFVEVSGRWFRPTAPLDQDDPTPASGDPIRRGTRPLIRRVTDRQFQRCIRDHFSKIAWADLASILESMPVTLLQDAERLDSPFMSPRPTKAQWSYLNTDSSKKLTLKAIARGRLRALLAYGYMCPDAANRELVLEPLEGTGPPMESTLDWAEYVERALEEAGLDELYYAITNADGNLSTLSASLVSLASLPANSLTPLQEIVVLSSGCLLLLRDFLLRQLCSKTEEVLYTIFGVSWAKDIEPVLKRCHLTDTQASNGIPTLNELVFKLMIHDRAITARNLHLTPAFHSTEPVLQALMCDASEMAVSTRRHAGREVPCLNLEPVRELQQVETSKLLATWLLPPSARIGYMRRHWLNNEEGLLALDGLQSALDKPHIPTKAILQHIRDACGSVEQLPSHSTAKERFFRGFASGSEEAPALKQASTCWYLAQLRAHAEPQMKTIGLLWSELEETLLRPRLHGDLPLTEPRIKQLFSMLGTGESAGKRPLRELLIMLARERINSEFQRRTELDPEKDSDKEVLLELTELCITLAEEESMHSFEYFSSMMRDPQLLFRALELNLDAMGQSALVEGVRKALRARLVEHLREKHELSCELLSPRRRWELDVLPALHGWTSRQLCESLHHGFVDTLRHSLRTLPATIAHRLHKTMSVGSNSVLRQYELKWDTLLVALNDLEKRLRPDAQHMDRVTKLLGISSVEQLFDLPSTDDAHVLMSAGCKNLRQLLAANLALVMYDRVGWYIASDIWNGLSLHHGRSADEGGIDLQTLVGYFLDPEGLIEKGLGDLLNSIADHRWFDA